MGALSETQKRALGKLSDEPQSAYGVQESIATLRSLVKKGLAVDVTPYGPGGMFSPQTHYKFVAAKARGEQS